MRASADPGRAAIGLLLLAIGVFLPASLVAQVLQPQRSGLTNDAFRTAIPNHAIDIVLGRPTDRSVTLSLLSPVARGVALSWTDTSTGVGGEVVGLQLAGGEPRAVELPGLSADREYRYAIREPSGLLAEGRFRTQRRPGAPFMFTVTADSHLDAGTRTETYERTLRNIAADAPDLHFDLGDTFMTEKYADYRDAGPQYLAQRYWLGHLAVTTPLFLVLGNHDGEFGYIPRSQQRGMPEWAAAMRTSYFPNPFPNEFYSGSPMRLPAGAPLQNYYAFTWGDALFVVLDPFWPTQGRSARGDAGWDVTLGGDQYRWLEQVLSRSDARFRFVFIHHLVGGRGPDHRGGIEYVPFYEWGGLDANGQPGFAVQRPGWEMPIHALLAKHGVNIVFHGHDHLFARQELDGITYQAVPQPSHPEQRVQTLAREYGYLTGDILPSPGHVRVQVTPATVQVEYVRSFLPHEARQGRINGEIDLSYVVKPR